MKQVAAELNIPKSLVSSIVEHCMKYLYRTIKAGKYEGVNIPVLGTFYVKQANLDHIRERISRTRQPDLDRPRAEDDTGV